MSEFVNQAYACRAGTTTPFNTETSISAEESNYWGSYPYLIEDNYFSQGNLETQPGVYRNTTVEVDSFNPNAWGLYNMHGNVGEWVWDYYGDYDSSASTDPTGPESGTRRVYRGGGWNDFAKNLRSAYRAAAPAESASFNIGIRLVRNAAAGTGNVEGTSMQTNTKDSGKVLIAYFSWGGNTRGIAEEIQRQTGADLFEITPVTPYSDDYNTVLDEAQRDQNAQARPELQSHVEDMGQYDTIILGYDMLTTDEFNGEDILVDEVADTAGEAERNLLLDKLRLAIADLSEDERQLLDALYFHGLTERDWSAQSGIPQKTINDRKKRLLIRLRKIFEK